VAVRVLVDTHAIVWWLLDKPSLSSRSRALFADDENEILISAAVAWELATKARSGKWPEAHAIASQIASVIDENRFTPLSITVEHARVAGLFVWQHRDPFDRVLAAQAQIEGIPLLSADPVFRAFGTSVIW
jgi:PIN domain nuclease of toxin-antitoxin system